MAGTHTHTNTHIHSGTCALNAKFYWVGVFCWKVSGRVIRLSIMHEKFHLKCETEETPAEENVPMTYSWSLITHMMKHRNTSFDVCMEPTCRLPGADVVSCLFEILFPVCISIYVADTLRALVGNFSGTDAILKDERCTPAHAHNHLAIGWRFHISCHVLPTRGQIKDDTL